MKKKFKEWWYYLSPLIFTLGMAILAAAVVVSIFYALEVGANGGNSFIKGVDYGKSFLSKKKPKGKKYRAGVWKNVERFGPWFEEYMPHEMVPAGSRAHLESRGNWWSHTKDTTLLEAGLMSNGYAFTRQVCKDTKVCGDPCGDPRFSIALAGYRRYLARDRMFNEEGFWEDWLLEQAQTNRWEAEAFVGACGSINCQKLRKAIKVAHKERGILNHRHKWWQLMKWYRDQTESRILWVFAPKTELWKLGSRVGRVMAGLHMRAEFYEPDENGDPVYGWGDELMYFPHRTEMKELDGVLVPVQVPDLPEPIHKWTISSFPSSSEWRKRCYLYGTGNWKKATGEPKPKDRYKRTACRDGICWGQRKYPTDEDFQIAHANWVDEMQIEGRLPTDQELDAWKSTTDLKEVKP